MIAVGIITLINMTTHMMCTAISKGIKGSALPILAHRLMLLLAKELFLPSLTIVMLVTIKERLLGKKETDF